MISQTIQNAMLNTIFRQNSEMMAKILTDQELGEIVCDFLN